MSNQNDGPLKVNEYVRDKDGRPQTIYGNSQAPNGHIDDPNHGHMVQKESPRYGEGNEIIALRPQGPKGTPDIVNTGE